MAEVESMDTDSSLPQTPDPTNSDQHPTSAASPTSSTSSSSSSDSSSDDEAQQSLQLQSLESHLSSNPADYDAHLQYVQLLRKMGEVEKLRKAREDMSELFPLTPSMWMEWAKDETTMAPEAIQDIGRLYERGVFDYLSVPLWCAYLVFVQEHDPAIRGCSVDGILKARNLFERALTAAGVHFTEGNKIWELYKEFEQAIYLTIDESDIEGKEKQIQRVRSIFHRQLSVPLADMNSSLLAYKVWEVQQGNEIDVNSSDLIGISPHVASAYKKALEMHNARLKLEEQISESDVPDSERLPLFKKYLKFEESAGDPARVQILYERAITEFPVASDLWLDYTRYLDKTFRVGNALKDVNRRATRNCPWVGELWVRYLLCLERARASEEEVSLVFERALQCTFSSYEEYLDLFLTRIDGLRRKVSGAGEMQVLDYAVIRDTFQRGSDYLSPHMKGTNALLRLHAYWARLELNLANDIVAARGVWESLLKISGTMLEAWQGYIDMEIGKGNLNEARSIYRRCYTKRFPGSGSEDICQSWLWFEREFGTLEEYDSAVSKLSPRLNELQVFRIQQESRTVATSGEREEQSSRKVAREKRKSVSNLSEDQSPSKRQKEMSEASKKGTKKNQEKTQSVIGKPKVEETVANVGKSNSSNEPQRKQTTYEKPIYTDQCTAFVSNLSIDANYEHLRSFFGDDGGIQSIRILRDRFTGKSRGLAYVDFSDDTHLNAALAKNKKMLLNKKISIARSDPTKSKKRSDGRQNADTEDSKKPSKESADQSSRKGHNNDGIQLKGKNIFAVPRNVRIVNKPKVSEDELPKSNDEFREMVIKK